MSIGNELFVIKIFEFFIFFEERTRARIWWHLFGKDNRNSIQWLDGSTVSKHEANSFGQ
jgi:hypothetical protein